MRLSDARQHVEHLTRHLCRHAPIDLDEKERAQWIGALANFPTSTEKEHPAWTSPAQELQPLIRRHPELLGWAYQEWGLAMRKHRVKEPSPTKEVTAATQLFTDEDLAIALVDDALDAWEERSTAEKLRWRVLDPCCGAGHLLVHLFRRLLPDVTKALHGNTAAAARHLYTHTLRGIELDTDCANTATLTLYLELLKYLDAQTLQELPTPIASFHTPRPEVPSPLSDYGSLWRPEMKLPSSVAVRSTRTHPIWSARVNTGTAECAMAWLSETYDCVLTNVPFLARGKQPESLRELADQHYSQSRRDLSTMFVQRCLELCNEGGEAHLITPQNWLFLRTYRDFRRHLLSRYTFHSIRLLGEGGFESAGAAGAFAAFVSLQHSKPDPAHTLTFVEGPIASSSANISAVRQRETLSQPDATLLPLSAPTSPNQETLSDYAQAYVGIQTGDDPRYIRAFWEFPFTPKGWEPLHGTPHDFVEEDGDSWLIHWDDAHGPLHASSGARPNQGRPAWGQQGIAIHRMRRVFAYRYSGHKFHQNIAVLVPKHPEDFDAISAFCHAPAFEVAVRAIDKKLNVTNGTLIRVPFDRNHWANEAKTCQEPPRSSPPRPFLQRDFSGPQAMASNYEHLLIIQSLGYTWPTESLSDTPPFRWLELHDPQTFIDLQRYFEERSSHLPVNATRWLRDQFFEEHCRLFLQRPFIWHLWDGEPDGFSVLLNYHRFDGEALRELLYERLPRWIHRIPQDAHHPRLNAAAQRLEARLQAIEKGDAPFDIFVRWKPLSEQPLGWEPQLADGVRMNLRPWVTQASGEERLPPLLRVLPSLHYRNDRGNDGERSYFPEHGVERGGNAGDRVNDWHLTLDQKRRR